MSQLAKGEVWIGKGVRTEKGSEKEIGKGVKIGKGSEKGSEKGSIGKGVRTIFRDQK
jgi:hypothetical protein